MTSGGLKDNRIIEFKEVTTAVQNNPFPKMRSL